MNNFLNLIEDNVASERREDKESRVLTEIAFIDGPLSPISVTLEMKIEKEGQKRGIEDSIEAPSPNPGASRSIEVIVKHETGNCEAKHELNNLEIGDGAFPGRTET